VDSENSSLTPALSFLKSRIIWHFFATSNGKQLLIKDEPARLQISVGFSYDEAHAAHLAICSTSSQNDVVGTCVNVLLLDRDILLSLK
jgi:hypothetical protein